MLVNFIFSLCNYSIIDTTNTNIKLKLKYNYGNDQLKIFPVNQKLVTLTGSRI